MQNYPRLSFRWSPWINFHYFCFCASEESDDTDASSHIPLDDALLVDYSAIEVIQCLIEHHKEIFTNAN